MVVTDRFARNLRSALPITNVSPPRVTPFQPLVIGALYPALERGLTADVLAARALGGQALAVCTSLVVAGNGRVTDVLDVPSDTVTAQLAHVFDTATPTGARVGICGSAASVEAIFEALGQHLKGPLVLDATLSGPSGEDIADGRVREALQARFPLADVVTMRRADAELIAAMEITSLDDAQVAVQRIHKMGARTVLLRCGTLPASTFDADTPSDHASDLFYDGEEFALFEAPHIAAPGMRGASSALALALLHALHAGRPLPDAIQRAKAFVSEAVRLGARDARAHPDYAGATAHLPEPAG